MQKLTGIRSGQNNKSCRIIHHESNKIGFAFFWFFYDFIWSFKVPAKRGILLKMWFAPRPSGRFKTLQPGPRFADKPLERKSTLQLGPPGGSPDSGGLVAVIGRGLAEGVLWVIPARFTGWVEAEGSPASRRTDGRRREPLRVLLWRQGGVAKARRGSSRCYGCRGNARAWVFAVEVAGGGSSAGAAAMARAGV
jgi:hypothetical protein